MHLPCNTPSASLPAASHRRQSGGVLIQFAIALMLIITMLGVLDIGYLYYVKRDLQRIADLAALEATENLVWGEDASCPAAIDAGDNSIASNWPVALRPIQQQVLCGNWQAEASPRFVVGEPVNAAEVTLRGEAPKLLPFDWNRTVLATATSAKTHEPVAAFSVGSQLLQFNNNRLLGRLVAGLGLDIERLTVLDKDGVANVRITPAGLLDYLGLPVGVEQLALLTPDDIANVDVSLLDLIDAAILAAGDDLLNVGVDIGALQALRAYLQAIPLANVQVPLGGEGGVLAFIAAGRDASSIGAGLDAVVHVADLVRTQLAIASGNHALDLNLGILGLATARLSVVEPPTIAIGPANGQTKARSAQVRLALAIGGSDSRSVSLTSLLGLVLAVINTEVSVDIPIQVDLVRSTGTLEHIQCTTARNTQTVNISVHSAVGDVCVGLLDRDGNCLDADLVHVRLLHNSILNMTLSGHLEAAILQSPGSVLSHPADPVACPFNAGNECLTELRVADTAWSGPNGLRLGDTVASLLGGILDLVRDLANNSELRGFLGVVLGWILGLLGFVTTLVNVIVDLVSGILSPVLNALGAVLDVVLAPLLGAEVGRAEVEVLGIHCDTAQLVQ